MGLKTWKWANDCVGLDKSRGRGLFRNLVIKMFWWDQQTLRTCKELIGFNPFHLSRDLSDTFWMVTMVGLVLVWCGYMYNCVWVREFVCVFMTCTYISVWVSGLGREMVEWGKIWSKIEESLGLWKDCGKKVWVGQSKRTWGQQVVSNFKDLSSYDFEAECCSLKSTRKERKTRLVNFDGVSV